MANELLTTDLIAKELLLQVKNNLVMARLVHTDYEETFQQEGDTIRVRRPVRYTTRRVITANPQDTKEGNVEIKMNRIAGVDMRFSSIERTLNISEFSKRYVMAAASEIAHTIDSDIHELYKKVANWAWRKTNLSATDRIASFDDYSVGPQRLDENGVATDMRRGVLSPADYWGIAGSLTSLQADRKAIAALETAKIGRFANTDTYSTQQVWEHVVGASGSPATVINTSTQVSTYEAVMDTTPLQATYTFTGTAAVTDYYKAGDVITIQDVFDINPRTRQRIGTRLKQFVVLADTSTANGTFTMAISPAIIPTGAQQNCAVVSAGASKTVTRLGTAATQYRQNLVFHRNAFAFVTRPLVVPDGVVDATRASDPDSGLSLRIVPYYDGTNDVSNYRVDILYGTEAIQPELATRLTASSA